MAEEPKRNELKAGDYVILLRANNGYPQGTVLDLSSKYTRDSMGVDWIGKTIGPESSISSFSVYGVVIVNPTWGGMITEEFLLNFMRRTSVNSHYLHIMNRQETAEALENVNARLKFINKQFSEKIEEFKNYPDRDTYVASKLVKQISDIMDKHGKLTPKDLAPVIKNLNL